MQVIARGATFASLVREAFDQIRDGAADNAAIYLRLLGALETVAQQTANARRRATLGAHVNLIAHEAERELTGDYNLQRVCERVTAVRATLKSEAQVKSFTK